MKALIDLSSIQKNPKAGFNKTYEQGSSTVSFEFEGNELPDFLKPGDNCFITSEEQSGYKNVIVKGYLIGSYNSDMKSENLTFQVDHDFIEVKTHNPEYLYDFLKINIPCPKCGFVFTDVDQIESEVLTDSEDNEYLVTICSNCKKIIDLELEYETIAEALKRQTTN